MFHKQKSQIKDVLNYMKEAGSISSFEAFEKFHITRLSSIIHRLRKMGYSIITVPVGGKNDYGTYEYAMYVMEAEE